MNKKAIAGVGILGGAIALWFGANAYTSRIAAKEVDAAIESVSSFVKVDYDKVETSLLNRQAKVKRVKISPLGGAGEPIKVNEVVLYKYDRKDGIPTYVNLAVNGMDLAAAGSGAQNLKEFGYSDNLSLNFATEYKYEPEAKQVQLKQFKVGADEVGDMTVSFQISNVNDEALAMMPFSLLGMSFDQAQITYRDDSFMERWFKAMAAAENTTVDAVKKEIIADLEKEQKAEGTQFAESDLKEMKEFINNPKSFTISFSPDSPVPLSSLMTLEENPTAFFNLLSARFEAN